MEPRVIVIGSGLHKQVLGECTPLSSWDCLLRKVAKKGKMSSKLRLCADDPVLAWEQLVAERASGRGDAAKEESILKKSLCRILDDEAKKVQSKYSQDKVIAQLGLTLKQGGIHLVSLNFDHLAHAGLNGKPSVPDIIETDRLNKDENQSSKSRHESIKSHRDADLTLLYERKIVSSSSPKVYSTVWHPHGHIGRSESLRLGMRDYGFLPQSYYIAFRIFKKWESEVAGKLNGAAKYNRLIEALEEMDAVHGTQSPLSPADNWVTRFMLYPVDFIGVGLSQVEIGMRWLLVQRARNFAKVDPKEAPPVIYHGAKAIHFPGVQSKRIDPSPLFQERWITVLN